MHRAFSQKEQIIVIGLWFHNPLTVPKCTSNTAQVFFKFELILRSHRDLKYRSNDWIGWCSRKPPFALSILGGGFKYFLFSPLFGEDFQFDYIIFFRWVETTTQYLMARVIKLFDTTLMVGYLFEPRRSHQLDPRKVSYKIRGCKTFTELPCRFEEMVDKLVFSWPRPLFVRLVFKQKNLRIHRKSLRHEPLNHGSTGELPTGPIQGEKRDGGYVTKIRWAMKKKLVV